MDFLYSLKYYCQRWPRAKLFAKMLGFLLEEKINYFSDKKGSKESEADRSATPNSAAE
jgi:hypothetical protein